MRAVPLLAGLACFLVSLTARAESTAPPVAPPRPPAPVLRPGQLGVQGLDATAGTGSWNLSLRKGDSVLLQAASPAAFTLRVQAPAGPGGPPEPMSATAQPDPQGVQGFVASLALHATRRGVWQVAMRPDKGSIAAGKVAVRCVAGPSCARPPSASCGPTGSSLAARTPGSLLATAARFQDRQVKVRARVRIEVARCTTRACPPDACCNACGATLVAGGPSRSRKGPAGLSLEGLTCQGTNCDFRERCLFPPGTQVTAWGVFRRDDGGARLVVHGACGPLPRGD